MTAQEPERTASGPLVSIITPTLNQGRFIEQTIRSIQAQTYRKLEHIVIDGGSTDETHDILRRHEGTYPMRWISEPDRGMYDAINKGLRIATGDILAYLNSDDLYFPWTLGAVVESMRADSSIAMVYGDALRLNDSDGSLAPMFQPPFRQADMIGAGSLVQPTVFWRHEVAKTTGEFDSSLRYVGDVDYWMRASKIGRAVRLDEILAIDRSHAGAASIVARQAMAAEDLALRRRLGPHSRWRVAMATARAVWWRRVLWLSFVVAGRRRRQGQRWGRVLDACHPVVPVHLAGLGALPFVGSRFRRSIRWGNDPVGIALGDRPPIDAS